MNKSALNDAIVGALRSAINSALAAADEARRTATDKENIAENRYDTLGLEAAYLAHGQSARVLGLERELAAFRALGERITAHTRVESGSLVQLETGGEADRFVFLGPAAGGLTVTVDGIKVTVITPASPLGRSLMNGAVFDEITTEIKGQPVACLITGIW